MYANLLDIERKTKMLKNSEQYEEIPGAKEVEALFKKMRKSIEEYMKAEELLAEIRKKAEEFLGADKKEMVDVPTLEVKETFTMVLKETEKFLDPRKGTRSRAIAYFKGIIPKGLPRCELKSLLRKGIYQVWMASDLQVAQDSLKKLQEDYYKAEMIVKCKIRNYNS